MRQPVSSVNTRLASFTLARNCWYSSPTIRLVVAHGVLLDRALSDGYPAQQHLREKKVETQTRRQPSLTVKASREPQNSIWNQGSMEASSLKEEKAISLSI